ncbi:hypothetical protein SGPA1_31458 [Streptomyces misionensis JCM 4497]
MVGARAGHHAGVRPAGHTHARGRRRPRDRADLARRPAQRAPADLLRGRRAPRPGDHRGTRRGLPAGRAQPAGPAGAAGRPGAAAGRRIRLLHQLPPGRVPPARAARPGRQARARRLADRAGGAGQLRGVRGAGARLRAGAARRARHGGSRRRPAVPGRGRGGLRRAPAGLVPGLPRPGHLIGGRSP